MQDLALWIVDLMRRLFYEHATYIGQIVIAFNCYSRGEILIFFESVWFG